MLELRPCCEHCGKDLPPHSTDAMICSYECTYCKNCAEEIFEDICPSCGGNFVPRPIRPKEELAKDPASTQRKHIPKDLSQPSKYSLKYKGIPPEKR